MNKLSSEELKDYNAMIEKQKSKPVLENKSKNNSKNIITEAYIHALCVNRGVSLSESVNVSENTKNKIYQLYLSGVLPLRLGGINL